MQLFGEANRLVDEGTVAAKGKPGSTNVPMMPLSGTDNHRERFKADRKVPIKGEESLWISMIGHYYKDDKHALDLEDLPLLYCQRKFLGFY